VAEIILRVRVDPVTGKREVVIDYASDADALPMEHEHEHKKLAGKVLEGGLENPNVTVSRETEAPATEPGETAGEAAPVATPVGGPRGG
jgi:hypothetical protein